MPVSKGLILVWFGVCAMAAQAQSLTYPKEIRGYKVERAVIELKDSKTPVGTENDLIRLGDPQGVSMSPLGITLEIPIVVSPVKQKGKVDFLVFEEMVVNGTSVQIDEYHRAFALPNKNPLTLREPLKFSVYLPNAVLAALGELRDSKEKWVISGRVFVFGRFKKSIFSFKRCIPIELDLTIQNPLKRN